MAVKSKRASVKSGPQTSVWALLLIGFIVASAGAFLVFNSLAATREGSHTISVGDLKYQREIEGSRFYGSFKKLGKSFVMDSDTRVSGTNRNSVVAQPQKGFWLVRNGINPLKLYPTTGERILGGKYNFCIHGRTLEPNTTVYFSVKNGNNINSSYGLISLKARDYSSKKDFRLCTGSLEVAYPIKIYTRIRARGKVRIDSVSYDGKGKNIPDPKPGRKNDRDKLPRTGVAINAKAFRKSGFRLNNVKINEYSGGIKNVAYMTNGKNVKAGVLKIPVDARGIRNKVKVVPGKSYRVCFNYSGGKYGGKGYGGGTPPPPGVYRSPRNQLATATLNTANNKNKTLAHTPTAIITETSSRYRFSLECFNYKANNDKFIVVKPKIHRYISLSDFVIGPN